MPEGDRPGFGRVLREVRLAVGVTQAELAHRAGVSLGTIRDLEQGRRVRPRAGSVARLSAALGLDARLAERLAGAVDAATSGGGLWVQVLGPVLAWRDGRPLDLGSARQRAVLALLALQRDGPVLREAIVDAVWPDGPPATAVNMVQAYVGRLRRVIEAGEAVRGGRERSVVTWSGESYRLRLTADELDLLTFDDLAARAAAAAPADPAVASSLYEQALGLWHGDPAAGTGVLRTHPAVTGLIFRRSRLVVEYAKVACPQGWHDQVLGHLRVLAGQEPLNEPAHAWLMIALAGSGQQAAALEVYADCRQRLDQQLGVHPGADLSRAHSLVLRQEVPAANGSPAPGTGAATAAQNQAGRGWPGENGQDEVLVPRQLPPEVANFVGRADELSTLTRLATGQDGGTGGRLAAISAIGGSAGIGKTALAVHFAHQWAADFPDGQLYVDLHGFGPSGPPMAPGEVLGGFLDALNVPPGRVPEGLDERAALYRSLLARKRLLVLLDNARDEAQVRPLLPGGSSCLTLVTSRQRLAGLAATAGARLVELDVPTDAESADLLSARLGDDRVAAEPGAARDLIQLCARLPLGLVIVAARAAVKPGFPLAVAVAELRDAGRRLDVLDTGDPVASVRAVFDWSYRNLTAPAARMFRLLGLHPGPDASVGAAASLASLPPGQAAALLDELTRAHLTSERVPGRFTCHDLLRAYAAEQTRQIDSEADRRAAVHRMLDHYLHTAVAAEALIAPGRRQPPLPPIQPGSAPESFGDDSQAFAWFQAEDEVLKAMLGLAAAAGFDQHAWQLPRALMSFQDRRGYWRESAETSLVGLAVAQRIGDRAAQAMLHSQLGRVYGLIGSYATASEHAVKALSLWQQLGDRAGQAYAHHGVGHNQSLQGQIAEAVEHEREALRLYTEIGDRYGEANTLNDLGWYYAILGDTAEAIAWARRAVDLNAELHYPFGTAQSLDTLGYAHALKGDHAEAVACYRRALTACRELAIYYQAVTLNHLGDALQAAGEPESARAAWRESLAIFDQLRHPDAAGVRPKLGTFAHIPG
jgi:DNA-binding SARP family transcriptional activator/tetratricopeptide (TPR) repeat protein/DNA-binding XRE family transcriptional regulator